jgi:hypothetical protein
MAQRLFAPDTASREGIMGKIPSISQVVARIVRPGQKTKDLGEDAIRDSGRGLRLIHGKVRTRDASEGMELNFLKRIMQERKIVEGFEKEIGDTLGKSEARKLLKKVGVHQGIFDFNPKINAQQTEQLDELFKKALKAKPRGMKESIDKGQQKWSGRFSLSKESTTRMLTEMKTHFGFHFQKDAIRQKDKIELPVLFVSELQRASIILDDGVTSTNLKGKEPAEAQKHVETFVGGDRNAAYNLGLILTPHTMFFADKAVGDQHGLTAVGSKELEQRTYRVQKTGDQYKVSVDQKNRRTTSMHCIASSTTIHMSMNSKAVRRKAVRWIS